MGQLATVVGWGFLVFAGLAAGALVASRFNLPERVAAEVTTFGGGLLLAAVAFELVPEADSRAGLAWTSAGLVAGAVLYVSADAWLARDEHRMHMRRSGHAAASGRPMTMPRAPAGRGEGEDAASGRAGQVARGESIAAGIVTDGIPESLALGITAAEGAGGLALLAAVVLGNVTEAYGAAQPIVAGGRSRRFAVGLLSVIGVVLAVATLLGGTVVVDAPTAFVGGAQAVAAGAILAVLSISILPYAFEQANRRVALAATIGFTVGYLLSA